MLRAGGGPAEQRFEAWRGAAGQAQERALVLLEEIAAGDSLDLATLVVAVRVIRSMLRSHAAAGGEEHS